MKMLGENVISAQVSVIFEPRVFAKRSAKTPKTVLEVCRRRLKEYDSAGT